MLNCIIWGFAEQYTEGAFLRLQAEGIINIQEWFGQVGDSIVVTRNMSDYWNYDFFRQKVESLTVSKKKWWPVFREIEKKLFVFADLFSRHQTMVWDVHECRHIFDRLFWHFLNMIVEKNIRVIIFSNIPHEGPDYILYSIAKQLGIKTILSYQSLFPNRFFCVESIEGLGEIDHVLPDTDADFIAKIIKEDLPPKEWDFMLNAGENTMPRDIMQCFAEILYRFNYEPWDVHSRYDLFWQGLKDIKEHNYQSGITQNCEEPVAGEEYIYFPLCLQPELTTAAIGDIFCEQTRAIEMLADKINTELSLDCKIYVKENPKQTHFMRSCHFFHRLKSLDCVRFINPQASTFSLIKNCLCVATIAGTAGYEAVFMNKSAIYFGHPWYKKLHGAFHYQTSLDEIINFVPDRQRSISSLTHILKCSRAGVVDPGYISQVYRDHVVAVEKNTLNIYHHFRSYLENVDSHV